MVSLRLFLLLSIVSFNALAIDLKGHQFTDAYRYSLLEDSYTEKFNDSNVFLGSYAYVHSPFYYTDDNVNSLEEEIIRYNNVLTLGYTRYVNSALALGLDAVGVQNKVLRKSYSGLGDTNLRGKYLLSDRGLDWGLSLNPFVTLPTGKEKNFTTARSIGGGLRAVLEKHLTQWHLLGSLGYGHSPKNDYEIVDQRNLLLTQLGISYDINADWNANAEITRNFTVNADERQDEGDYFITMKNKTTEQISLYGGAGIAGAQEVERNNYTLFLGFKWQELLEQPAPEAPKPSPVVVKPKPIAPAQPANRKQESLYGALIKLNNIYFANNKSDITPVEMEKVMSVVEVYRELGDKFSKVIIEGFASTRGNTAANQLLGQQRTRAVMRVLVSNGIPQEKMAGVSYGDLSLQDKEEWKNRKVQFRIYRHH